MGTRIDEDPATVIYYSPDLNLTIRGKVISEGGDKGETEGTVFELATGYDAVQIVSPTHSIGGEEMIVRHSHLERVNANNL